MQPVDPLNLWLSPPFEPKLETGPQGDRIVARGASDDKGQLMTFLEACRAFKQFGGPPCQVTALFEGEVRYARDAFEGLRLMEAAMAVKHGVPGAALPALTATSAAVIQLSVPAIAALGGVVLLAEPLSSRLVIASLTIMGGIALTILRPRT